MFHLLLLLHLVISTFSWRCDGVQTLTVSENHPAWVPSNNTEPQPYEAQLNCKWQFSVPMGNYATVTVNANFSNGDTFVISNSVGYSHQYSNFGDIPKSGLTFYFFPAELLTTVTLTSGIGPGAGSLTFSILLHKLPLLPRQEVVVNKGYPVFNLLGIMTNATFVFDSSVDFMFGLAATAPDNKFDSCFVYKGQNPMTGDFLAGLKQFSLGQTERFSSTTSLLCLDAGYPEAYLIATTIPNDFDVKSMWLVRMGYSISATVATKIDEDVVRPAYVTTYCPANCVEYLQNVQEIVAPGKVYNTTVSLFAGMPGNLSLLSFFGASDANYNLPQELRGILKTIAIDQSMAGIIIDRNSTDFKTAQPGRRGFFMSQNYPLMSSSQSAATIINASDPLNFSFRIEQMNVGGGSFSASISYKNMKGFSIVLQSDTSNGDKIPSQMGYSMGFQLNQGLQPSTGGIVRFEISSSTIGLGLLVTIISSLFAVGL